MNPIWKKLTRRVCVSNVVSDDLYLLGSECVYVYTFYVSLFEFINLSVRQLRNDG